MKKLVVSLTYAGKFMLAAVASAVVAATSGSQECASVAISRSSVKVEYDAKLAAAGGAAVVVFAPSDDGALSAIEESGGKLLWTFRPPELADARANTGLMTDIAVLRFDANNDGFIDAGVGDRVWLYFGMRRGGPRYYALDVTKRTPRTLWVAGADTLDGLADAWSTPTITRLRIAGSGQNGEHFVLVIGGGYAENAAGGVPDAGNLGNRLFILDAATGRMLWTAGNQPAANRVLPQMTHGLAARVTAIDLDGDEFTDRLYAADVGGRIWRFDVWNGRAPDELVTGGVFASLGAVEPLGAPAAASDARQFFNAPDVALMQPRGKDPWYNIAIGSGNGRDARGANAIDRFYSLRDRDPFVKRAQFAYDGATPIYDGDLTEIIASSQSVQLPGGSSGWKLSLTMNGVNAGEKVLAKSLTASGVVLFTTWQPALVDGDECAASGTNRVYAVRVEEGKAALDLNGDEEVTPEDLYSTLAQDVPVGEPRIEIVRPAEKPPESPGAPAESDVPGNDASSGVTGCYLGDEQLSRCVPMDTVVRTFWKRTMVN